MAKKNIILIAIIIVAFFLFVTKDNETFLGAVGDLTCEKEVMFILDRSGSMINQDPQKFANVKDATRNFIDVVNFSTTPGGLVTFSDDASLVATMGSDPVVLRAQIHNMVVGGATYTGQAIEMAKDNFAGASNPTIIMLTDGGANIWPNGFCFVNPTSPTNCTNYAIEQANLAKANNVDIYTIGVDVNSFVTQWLSQIASGPGKSFSVSSSPTDLEFAYNQIASQICTSSCIEDWTCTDWSTCVNDIQTRTCTDHNACGTTINMPPETQSCNGGTTGCTVPGDEEPCGIDSNELGTVIMGWLNGAFSRMELGEAIDSWAN